MNKWKLSTLAIALAIAAFLWFRFAATSTSSGNLPTETQSGAVNRQPGSSNRQTNNSGDVPKSAAGANGSRNSQPENQGGARNGSQRPPPAVPNRGANKTVAAVADHQRWWWHNPSQTL